MAAALAVFVLLPMGRALAGACEAGTATGAAPPVITHLRSYSWTFHAPTRMALGAGSSLMITDPARQRVITRDMAGRIVDSRRLDGQPVSIAVDAAGRIYVGDGDRGQVRVYSREWEFLYDLGIGAGEFELPVAIAVEPSSGRIYVVDSKAHGVRVFRADGGADFSFGGQGDGDGLFNFPAGIFVDAANAELYVVDQLNFRVQVFDLQGSYLRCIGGTNASPGSFFGRSRPLNQPQGVWVDGAGRVLVSDAADGQVKVFDRNGNALATIGEFGSLPGGLRIPMDLAVDAGNRLFVAAANNARLEVFGLDQFQDPETVAPGVLTVEPGIIDRDALVERIGIALELPGYRLDAIMPGSLQVNGLAPIAVSSGDIDRNLRPELSAEFDAAALAQTLPANGEGRLVASALLNNGLQMEAQALVEVRSSDTDADDDGIDDAFDLCPDTVSATPTDAAGCSVEQACPCGDTNDVAWRNRGHYVVCLLRAAFRVREFNQMPRSQLKTLLPRPAWRQCVQQTRRQWRHR